MPKQNSIRIETTIVRVGPLMKQVLDEQKKSIKDVLHGIDEGSYYIAGEILAKKIMANKII